MGLMWSAAAAQQPAGTTALDPARIIGYLKQSIDWHRQITVQEQMASEPAEALFLADNRQISLQALRLSFDFARAAAQTLAGNAAPTSTAPAAPANQSLLRAANDAENEARATAAELEADRKKLQTARGATRRELQATIDELQAELDLANARSRTLHDIAQFVSTGGNTGGGLVAQIDQLERAVPELQAATSNNATAASNTVVTPSSQTQKASEVRGALALLTELIAQHRKVRNLDQLLASTNSMAATVKDLRAPFVAQLTEAANRGEQLAKQADVSDPAQLEQEKQQLESLAAQFKRLSALALPLAKQSVLLDVYGANLTRWRELVRGEEATALKQLLLRAVLFGTLVVIAIVLAEIWRRAIFRYIHDVRRRYQFLLLRRIVLWFVIAITVAFALATEIGSLATFAGLITAGIAVALQNVILAIAGYFFLIGKFGVRVGDRVQISGITGDVVDIGLIRLHLMEVGDASTGLATGRIVVFSNSVVFQPTASFFRQIPGTNFVWHEIALTFAPDTDYQMAEQRIRAAVERVYADYKQSIDEQHRQMEETLNMPVSPPEPRSHVRLTQGGIEIVVRYPAEVNNAAAIDDRIARELLTALQETPKLTVIGSATPTPRPTQDLKMA